MSALELGFDREECFAHNPRLELAHVAELRGWIASLDRDKGVPPDITDAQLLVFHHANELNMESTKRCIEVYYSVKKRTPEMFDERNLDGQREEESAEFLEYALMSGFTDEGCSVIFHRFIKCAPRNYHPPAANKVFIMTIDRCIYERGIQNNGVIFVYDFKGISIGHLLKGNVSLTSKYFQYAQEGMPIRVKAVHVLNCNSFFDKIMMFLRPFINKDVFSLIHLHMADEDPEIFFSEHVPKRMMPSDYGGLQADVETLHKENMDRLRQMKPYFDAEEKQRHAWYNSTDN